MRGPTLLTLRRTADALAKRQGQSTTTGHVLAAIASKPGVGAELLAEWRLTPEVLAQAARVLVDDHADAVELAVQRARLLAGPSRVPTGIHLLAALAEAPRSSARRTIEQCGASKLRVVVMQLATSCGRASSKTEPALDGRLIPAGILGEIVD